MARKSKTKKIKKKFSSKLRKIIMSVAFVCCVIFVLVCYFNPPFYKKVLDFITGNNYHSLVVDIEGDTANVNQLNDLEVYFIDVGNADSIFFVLPDGKRVLIDAGDNSTEYNEKMVDFIDKRTPNNVIDYVIATHTDSDHIGGMVDIFENFQVKKVLRPYIKYSGEKYNFNEDFNKGASSFEDKDAVYGNFLNCILNETYGDNIPCEWEFFTHKSDFAMNIVCGETKTKYTFDFLTPTNSLDSIDYKDSNDFSPFIKFEYQGFSIMLTGDAESDTINELLTKYREDYNYLDIDMLKVGHHGSTTSTTQELVNVLKPEYAVILCGDNSYGHPHKEVVEMLNLSTILTTKNNGNIKCLINKNGKESLYANV